MNTNNGTADDRAALLEAFAAELASAAYRIALQHGAGDAWIDLELDLWRALIQAVKKWDGDGRGAPAYRGRLREDKPSSFETACPRPDDFSHFAGGG